MANTKVYIRWKKPNFDGQVDGVMLRLNGVIHKFDSPLIVTDIYLSVPRGVKYHLEIWYFREPIFYAPSVGGYIVPRRDFPAAAIDFTIS